MTFLTEPATSAAQQQMYDEDLAEDGFVWNNSRLWAHQPALNEQFSSVIKTASEAAGLTNRERAMLVLGQATAIGDSYCSLAWSRWLTEWEDADTALAVLQRDDAVLSERERALARWAQLVATDANGTTAADVQQLRDAGFEDPQIHALTVYTALRMALSTTNDALGAAPDTGLAEMLDPRLRAAVTWGRPPA